MKKKKQNSEGGASWMDTYGDMVTLLLCFFVLLYSISSVDQKKWENMVKSFNPDAVILQEFQGGGADDEMATGNAMDTVESAEETEISADTFGDLFLKLQEMAEQMDIQDEVTISKGNGYTFISFRDKVFFDGDSPVLKPEGKIVLDAFAQVIASATDSIKELRVLGHTSQASPNIPNEVITDRVLSAERSAQVVAYIQEKNVIDPAKLVSVAYGQFRPIDTFSTTEGRARNRRAEIIITENGATEKSLEEYYEQVYGEELKQNQDGAASEELEQGQEESMLEEPEQGQSEPVSVQIDQNQ